MTTTTPPDRILIEAARRLGWGDLWSLGELRAQYAGDWQLKAMADTLTELDALGGIKWPVDRVEAAAQAAYSRWIQNLDSEDPIDSCREAIRLYNDEEWQP